MTITISRLPSSGTIINDDQVLRVGDTLTVDQLARLELDLRTGGADGVLLYEVKDEEGASSISELHIYLPGGSGQDVADTSDGGDINEAPVTTVTSDQVSAIPLVQPSGRTAEEAQSGGVPAIPVTDAGVSSLVEENGDRSATSSDSVDTALVAPSQVPATSAPSVDDGQGYRDCATCPIMIDVPAGGFVMGSDDGDPSERPAHSVNIDAFAIGKFEVKRSEWLVCQKAGSCPSLGEWSEETA